MDHCFRFCVYNCLNRPVGSKFEIIFLLYSTASTNSVGLGMSPAIRNCMIQHVVNITANIMYAAK